jgi:lipooligosaccharide transport system ATP-binding protein
MDEAEQLCDRLVVMDAGRIADEGSPRQLIERHCSREVLELRFDAELDAAPTDPATDATTDAPTIAARLVDIGDRVEVLPDRVLVYTDDGEAALATLHARGVRPMSSLVRRASLEDVFLHLTGRSLVD